MVKKIFASSLLGVILLVLTVPNAVAQTAPDLTRLQNALGGTAPDSVKATEIEGIFEVVMGSQILYVTGDGKFVFQGTIVDLESARNLTEIRLQSLRADQLASIDPASLISFGPETKAAHSVMVFTDIDCGYCRKLHEEMQTYNDLGIEIQYLAFPRAGLQSESYDKAVSAWCSEDPNEALTRAKSGRAIPSLECANPVESHYNLGQQLGVRGTPSIFLSNGEMVPGYVPADRLARMLQEADKAN